MLKIKSNRKTAFTLAETLITVVILGILAAILVPNLIKNQIENANRTKVKKAMAAYEKAINYIIIENDIKSTEALRELGQDNCQYTREYFKTVQDGSNNCIFKTADRVWWDITDITNPLISLKNEITDSNKAAIRTNALNYNADTTSFALIGRFDDLGTLRINDNAYEQTYGTVTNQKYVAKLWYFITQSISALSGLDRCKAEGAKTCTVTANGVSVNYTKVTTNTDTTVDKFPNGNQIPWIYDRKLNKKIDGGYSSIAPTGDYWISENLGTITEEEAKDMTGSVCTSQLCNNNGDNYEAAKRKCTQLGGHLASLAELEIARQNNKLSGTYSWSLFISAEESSKNTMYTLSLQGEVNDKNKTVAYYEEVICAGNN